MSILKAYRMYPDALDLQPLSAKRDWMDETPDQHAYRCFPVSLVNTLGWVFSAKQDLRFKWNGIVDTTPNNVEILEGSEMCHTNRGQASVSINTGYVISSDQNISVLTTNPHNYFNDDFQVISSVMTTSFYNSMFPLAIKLMRPNKEIFIPAGTPLATIIPISLSSLKDESIDIEDFNPSQEYYESIKSYGDAVQEINKSGKWADFYRNAVNENGESTGSHEVKSLKLKVNDNTRKR